MFGNMIYHYVILSALPIIYWPLRWS